MKIFLSWSGAQSRYIAESLRDWLPNVIQQVSPWLSAEDISPGIRWSDLLAQELMQAEFGIICLTPENVTAPWLLFEAGALSKAVPHSRVVPFLYDLNYAEIPSPLSQFQAIKASREGVFSLVHAINQACEHPVEESRIERAFDIWWPQLSERLSDTPLDKSYQLKQRATAEFILRDDFNNFDPEQEGAFLEALRRFLHAKYEIRIVGKFPGSTRIIVELEFEDAVRLMEAYNKGILPISGIISVSLRSELSQGEATVPTTAKFDVFLCHNSIDKPEVRKLAQELKQRGLSVWLDEEQLRPGIPWQATLEQMIESIRSAIVCIGESGLGPWQQLEMRAFLSELLRRGTPVIPVILPSATQTPDLPLFLREVTWVDLRSKEPDPYKLIRYGITGERA